MKTTLNFKYVKNNGILNMKNDIDKDNFLQKVKSVVVGHAVADALGVPVEFSSRDKLLKNPVTDMQGFGTYPVPKGSWSDDTSMTLCALDAFDGKKIDFNKVMQNFTKWYYKNEFTPTGKLFDIGITCSVAIDNYQLKNKSWEECGLFDERSNGNGSLMRIHPFSLYAYTLDIDLEQKIQLIEQASALTHAHKRSKMACGIYSFILWELLDNKLEKCEAVREGLKKARNYYENNPEFLHYSYKLCGQIADINNDLKNSNLICINESDIKSDGYVVNTLEAVVWCLLNTNSYESCVLKAVNLGNDTDTVGAIAGGLAGAVYGYNAIPLKWRETLIKLDYIEALCEKAFKKNKI